MHTLHKLVNTLETNELYALKARISWDVSYHSVFKNSTLESTTFSYWILDKFYHLSGLQFPHQCKGDDNYLMEHQGKELTHHAAFISAILSSTGMGYILLRPFTSSLYVSLHVKRVSCRWHVDGCWGIFYPFCHSVSLRSIETIYI